MRTLSLVWIRRRNQLVRFWIGMFPLSIPAAAAAIELPLLKRTGGDCVTVARLRWHTDYENACCEAKCAERMLLVNFLPEGNTATQLRLDRWIAEDASLRAKLKNCVLVRLPRDAKIGTLRKRHRLIDDPAFQHLGGQAGLAIIDYRPSRKPYYGRVVTALPFTSGKYYRWKNSHLAVALDLPPGTITQRTMVWAIRVHPEAPASTTGRQDAVLVQAATQHSAYQARVGVQGHQRFDQRYQLVRAKTGAATASEVVAES